MNNFHRDFLKKRQRFTTGQYSFTNLAKTQFMDSIDKQQPEPNREDLTGKKAVEKIRELADSSSCFFVTAAPTSGTQGARPMSVQKVDNEGNLWFLSASDSHKNHEIQQHSDVRLFFQGSGHSDFMELVGTASISADRNVIDELWMPLAKVWFTQGKDDPRITAICVKPTSGYYWDNKHGNFVAGVKMMIGAAIGKTLDDSIEGKLRA